MVSYIIVNIGSGNGLEHQYTIWINVDLSFVRSWVTSRDIPQSSINMIRLKAYQICIQIYQVSVNLDVIYEKNTWTDKCF